MNVAYLSIGTNLGEREENLAYAVELLRKEVNVTAVSSIYETAPVGVTDQPAFLNICVALETELEAHALLNVCQQIEQELGRVRLYRWGPRSIDLDILLFNHENIETESLLVPHPRMFERSFVIAPLVEIAPHVLNDVSESQRQQAQALNFSADGVAVYKP